jgi:hypothetical protein
LCSRSKHGSPEPGIQVQVAASHPSRNHNFLREPAEYLPTLRIQCTFKALYFRPFTMTRHTSGENKISSERVKFYQRRTWER